MTIQEWLANVGVEANTPIQSVANNPNVPAPVAAFAQITGNSVQYACGPTTYAIFTTVGINPDVLGV